MWYVIVPIITLIYYRLFNSTLWFDFSNDIKFDRGLDDYIGLYPAHLATMVLFIVVWPIYLITYIIYNSNEMKPIQLFLREISKERYHGPKEAKVINEVYKAINSNIDNIINHS